MSFVASCVPSNTVIAVQTFLSARPHIYKDATESATFAMLARLRETRGLYCTPTLLAGSLGQIKGMRTSGTAIYLKDYAVIRDKVSVEDPDCGFHFLQFHS